MKYRVTGIQPVLDAAPGEEFDADLDEVQEARLIAGGAIELVAEPATTAGKGKGASEPPSSEE